MEFSRPEYWAFPFARGSSQPKDQTQISCITGRFFTSWAIGKPKNAGVRCPRILELVAYPFSSKSSQNSNQTGVSCTAGRFFTNWAIREVKCRVIWPHKAKGQSNQRSCCIIYLTYISLKPVCFQQLCTLDLSHALSSSKDENIRCSINILYKCMTISL